LSTLERIISKEFKKAVTDDLKDERTAPPS